MIFGLRGHLSLRFILLKVAPHVHKFMPITIIPLSITPWHAYQVWKVYTCILSWINSELCQKLYDKDLHRIHWTCCEGVIQGLCFLSAMGIHRLVLKCRTLTQWFLACVSCTLLASYHHLATMYCWKFVIRTFYISVHFQLYLLCCFYIPQTLASDYSKQTFQTVVYSKIKRSYLRIVSFFFLLDFSRPKRRIGWLSWRFFLMSPPPPPPNKKHPLTQNASLCKTTTT